jgi:hypothetical protein
MQQTKWLSAKELGYTEKNGENVINLFADFFFVASNQTTQKSKAIQLTTYNEAEELAKEEIEYNDNVDSNSIKNVIPYSRRVSFILGFQKAKELYGFSAEDMVEFANWYLFENSGEKAPEYFHWSDKMIFDKWQSQRPILYECIEKDGKWVLNVVDNKVKYRNP